ncbi:tripartite tricarboxylate transporter TctB family protein [Nonomuraea sp. MG754425]|uniref:tripartite tricarboxylate transporter TctB family protein n=1 Tax=Nonomuraea sp. MG754425 TaxID=2570319 RepID=UPI001F301ADA|nr:tripartite tricarboxylate transporter TctB family protein [Nonomuraea sp. MG754425]MCF6473765.1 tripartite tricarboxylate transporter TctB family protein [Nonomuraea sp. MG754425]
MTTDTNEQATAPPEPETDPACDRRTALSSLIFGGLMLVAGPVMVVDARGLPDDGSAMGPAATPFALGVLLGITGLWLLLRSWRELRAATRGTPLRDYAVLRVTALAAALVAFALLLPVIGYVLGSAALFVGTALLLGGPHGWRLYASGWALAAFTFVIFDRVIGLTLPTGPWGF